MDVISRIIDSCRVCGSKNLIPILSLGDLYISDFLEENEVNEAEKAPLELVLCNERDGGCGLLQLKHTVSNEIMYRRYWYFSGTNKTMIDELVSIAGKVESLIDLKNGDYVIDIGANDGTLLRGYKTQGINRTGFEPAKNLEKYNSVGTKKIINDFFNYEAWQKEFGDIKAKGITAIAMFYDLDDPNKFVSDITKCLDKDGVFIIQMAYLPSMLLKNMFDNICHEHLEYYSLLSLENLLQGHNLEVFDVELNDINGGSFRIYIKHKDNGKSIKISDDAQKRVNDLREYEKKIGLNDKKVYDDFASRIEKIKKEVVDFIKKESGNGKKIYVYGASTKGNTLLQYFNLDNSLITAAAERNSAKWGKKPLEQISLLFPKNKRAPKNRIIF